MTKTNSIEQRRRAFAEHIAAGKSGVEAARLAGFKGKTHSLETIASRLLGKVEVQELVRAASEKASQGRIFDAAARREILRQIAQGEIEQEITTTGSSANGPVATTQLRKPTAAERKAAIEHLDRLDGLLVEKHEHTGKDGSPLNAAIQAVPEETIRARLAELAARKSKDTKK